MRYLFILLMLFCNPAWSDLVLTGGQNVAITKNTFNGTLVVATTPNMHVSGSVSIDGNLYADASNLTNLPPSMVYPTSGIPVSNGTGWANSIPDNSPNWNTAFGWGDHSAAGYVPGTRAVNGHVLSSDVTVTKSDVSLGNVTNDAQVKRDEMAAASGVATLDINGKLLTAQLPDSISGALVYKGTWNASTAVYPSTPSTGFFYIVSTAGTISSVPYAIGDWMVYNGASWDKIASTQSVTSVSGKTGDITLVKGDVGLGNVDNTSDVNKPVSSAVTTALGSYVPTSRTVNGKALSSDIVLGASDVDLSAYAPKASPTFTGTVSGINATMVGLGNVANIAQVTSVTASGNLASSGSTTPAITMVSNPTFSGLVTAPAMSVSGQGTFSQVNATTFVGALNGNATTATNALQWDGGSANLNASTAKTSLSLNNVTNNAQAYSATAPLYVTSGNITLDTASLKNNTITGDFTVTGKTTTGTLVSGTQTITGGETVSGLQSAGQLYISGDATVMGNLTTGSTISSSGTLEYLQGGSHVDRAIYFNRGTSFIDVEPGLYTTGNIGIGNSNPLAGLQIGAGTITGPTGATSAHIEGNLEVDGQVYSGNLFSVGVPDSSSAISYSLDADNALATRGSRLLEIKSRGVEMFSFGKQVGDLYGSTSISSPSGWLAFNSNGGTGRMDFNAGSAGMFFTPSGGILTAGSPFLVGRSGDASSTGTQKDSYRLDFQSHLWTGSAGQLTYGMIRTIASTTTNLAYRMGFFMNGTSSIADTGATEYMTITSAGTVGIGNTVPTGLLQVGAGTRSAGPAVASTDTVIKGAMQVDGALYNPGMVVVSGNTVCFNTTSKGFYVKSSCP